MTVLPNAPASGTRVRWAGASRILTASGGVVLGSALPAALTSAGRAPSSCLVAAAALATSNGWTGNGLGRYISWLRGGPSTGRQAPTCA